MKTDRRKELLLVAITILPLFYLFYVYDSLPAMVPTHWGIDGKADDYNRKETLWYFPLLVGVFVYLLTRYAPMLDPKRYNYLLFQGTYYKIRLVITVFFATLCIGMFYVAGHEMNEETVTPFVFSVVALLIAILGNYMVNIKPNYFVGVRTPWTLHNEVVWRKTHYLTGKLWFGAGLGMMLLSVFLSGTLLFAANVIFFIIIVVIPLVYSYKYHKQETKHAHE